VTPIFRNIILILLLCSGYSEGSRSIILVLKARGWDREDQASQFKYLQNFVSRTGYIEGLEGEKTIQVQGGLIAGSLVLPDSVERLTQDEAGRALNELDSMISKFPRALGLRHFRDRLVTYAESPNSPSVDSGEYVNSDLHYSNASQSARGIISEEAEKETKSSRLPDVFVTADGRKFAGVTSITRDPGGVTVSHETGIARVGYHDLTEEQRTQYELNQNDAETYNEKERSAAQARNLSLGGTGAPSSKQLISVHPLAGIFFGMDEASFLQLFTNSKPAIQIRNDIVCYRFTEGPHEILAGFSDSSLVMVHINPKSTTGLSTQAKNNERQRNLLEEFMDIYGKSSSYSTEGDAFFLHWILPAHEMRIMFGFNIIEGNYSISFFRDK
jgi:hypothetical protein